MFKVVNLVKSYFIFNLKACMEYRAAFVSQLFAVFINNGVFLIFWYLVVGQAGGDINGVEFTDIVMMWAIIASSFGGSEVLFGNCGKMSSIIFKGELDVYILQPKPILPNLVSSRMVMLGWGDLLYGFVVFFIRFGLNPTKFLLFLLFVITGSLVFTAFRVAVHSLTFFLGNNESLSNTLENLMLTAGVYPKSIFRGGISLLMYTIFPVAFMVYIPIEVLNNFSLFKLLIILLADCGIVLLSSLFFYLGIRKYESGNMIGARL